MGAAPSREVQEAYLKELKSRRQKVRKSERRRKEISLLPLTKAFMHHVQPSPTSRPTSPTSSKSGSRRSQRDGSSGGSSSSSRRQYMSARRVGDDAAPSSLPFMQQLYNAYREPSTQFYYRKEMCGPLNALPQDLFYPTLESFYAATVGCYEEDVYASNTDMQRVLEEYTMKERLASMDAAAGGGAATGQQQQQQQRGSEAAKRWRRMQRGPKIRPVPCAICFEYPTSSIVQPAPDGGADASASPAAALNRSGAPAGSVVFAPHCSFMVIGFVGLVPVRHAKKATAAAFLRPPATTAGDEGEGFCPTLPTTTSSSSNSGSGSAEEEGVEYELVAFISKSAGEQHLGRALFQAAFLYTEQCRRAGLFATPVPATRFSCFLTDVPSLCFLREVRLRCADAGWRKHLARALRRVRFAGRHLGIQMSRHDASGLCTFMAECYEKLDFKPPPTSCPFLFYGFVGDAGTQVLPSLAASPSVPPAPLPLSGSAEIMALLKEQAERESILGKGGSGGGGSGGGGAAAGSRSSSGGGSNGSRRNSSNNSNTNTPNSASHQMQRRGVSSSSAGVTGPPFLSDAASLHASTQLYCIVGTSRLTVGGAVYPHGTVLEQTVNLATGIFANAEWTVAVDRTGQEKPPVDFHEFSAEEAAVDHSLGVVVPGRRERRLTVTACDVLLSWSKDLYLHARVAGAADGRWISGYPLDYYTAGRNLYKKTPTAEQKAALRPPAQQRADATAANTTQLTAANVKALTTPPSTTVTTPEVNERGDGAADSTANAFFLWEFEHQQLRHTIGLVPNFVRAQQQQQRQQKRSSSSGGGSGPHGIPRRNSRENVAARHAQPKAVSSVDPTSEAHVSSSAASQSSRSGSAHGSQRSGRSVDTYRTAASSHSTMSNFGLVQGSRSSKQKRYFLSLGTNTVYENGVPVSGTLRPLSGERGSQTQRDDDGGGGSRRWSGRGGVDGVAGGGMDSMGDRQAPNDAFYDGGYSGYGGLDDNDDAYANSGTVMEGAMDYSGYAADAPAPYASLSSPNHHAHRQQQQQPEIHHTSLPYAHNPFATNTASSSSSPQQQLQRRLSGGVSRGGQASRRGPEETGGMLDSLYEGGGEMDEYGFMMDVANMPGTAPRSSAPTGVYPTVSTVSSPSQQQQQQVRSQLPLPQGAGGGRRGVNGPSQVLSGSQAQMASSSTTTTTTPTTGGTGSLSGGKAAPVLEPPGVVQSTHRGAGGQQEYRWDWRGGTTAKGK